MGYQNYDNIYIYFYITYILDNTSSIQYNIENSLQIIPPKTGQPFIIYKCNKYPEEYFMEVHKAELFYTDPNTKQEKTIIAEGKDEGDAAQNAVKRFKTFFPNLPVTCITRINKVIE